MKKPLISQRPLSVFAGCDHFSLIIALGGMIATDARAPAFVSYLLHKIIVAGGLERRSHYTRFLSVIDQSFVIMS